MLIGAWEWAGFGALRSAPRARPCYTLGVALVAVAGWRWTEDPAHLFVLLGAACAWWLIAFLWLALAPEWHRRRLTLVCGLAGPGAVFRGARPAADLRGPGFARGPVIVLWLVLLVIAADIGAYFAGRAFGRRKLAPRVSPGKTWEGAVGGLGMVASGRRGRRASLQAAGRLMAVVFGCAVGIFSVIGDLTESMFKRAAALKDSGTLLPGHGGLLDRIDSVTAAAPLYALGLFGSGVIR